MKDWASEKLTAEWRPLGRGDGLTMSMQASGRAELGALAARLDPAVPVRITTTDGTTVVTTAAAILEWRGAAPIPERLGGWPHPSVDQGDGAQAVDMLEAFLAWTKSRGLIDEAAARRISRWVQTEMAGEARDTPR